jgi:short-subunit dehydrogenase
MQTYAGKHIWIIGASSGIGEALARELAERGATLTLSARSENKLNAINEILGNEHTVLPVDAGNSDSLTKAAKTFKSLDSVVFMAAIYAPHSEKTKDIAFIHDMITVNLGGAFNTVDAVLPIFEKQGFGQIALCGSVAGYRGLPYGQPYCATKAGIINYAESLKIELEDKNIDVKIISPGFVRTPLTDKNEFTMPMMIEASDAAKIIHFPKRFTFIMKIIDVLPRWLYFPISRFMKKKQ